MTPLGRRMAAVLVSALIAAACSPVTSVAPARTGATGGGRAVIVSSPQLDQLTPLLANDPSTSDLTGLLYQSLVKLDPNDGTTVSGVAESFAVAPDGRTLTFTLRPGLRWSDGSELSADEFALTVQLVMRSKASARKSTFQDIVGTQDFVAGRATSISGIGVEGRTITVRLTRAFCPALAAIGTLSILPKKYFGKYFDPIDLSKTADAVPENSDPPVSSGPFKLKGRSPGLITLERNDLYYGTKPLLDEIVLRSYTDLAAQLAALRSGEVDLLNTVAFAPDEREELKRMPGVTIRPYGSPRYTYIGWNELRGGREFFQSKLVRQALAYGLNVDAVLDKVLGGDAVKMLAHTAPQSWAFDPTGLNEYRYDQSKAQQLLEQDGWTKAPDGVYQKGTQRIEFTLVTFDQPDLISLQREAVQQYAQIGVRVTPKVVSFPELTQMLRSKDPRYGTEGGRDVDAWIVRWVLGGDPDSYSIWHSSQVADGLNYVGYRSAVVDRAVEDGRTRCSLDQRKAAYHAMDRQLNEDQPYRFAFSPKAFLITSRRLQVGEPVIFGSSFSNVERWWVKG